MARYPERLYFPTELRKDEHGKTREIDVPKPRPRSLFRRFHRFWQRSFRAHGNAHGGVRGRSCFTSARQHLGRKYVETRDVSDCYPSISTEDVQRHLRDKGFRCDVAWVLSRLLTVHGRIPTGSPLSSDALNVVMERADNIVGSFCGRHGMSASRVYDDFVVSHNRTEEAGRPGQIVEGCFEDMGLKTNPRKRKNSGFQPNSRLQFVHGLIVNSKRGTRIAPKQRSKAVSAAESYVRSARSVSPDSLEMVAEKRRTAFGWMCHCRQAELGPAKHLRRLIDAGDRHVARALSAAGLATHKRRWWVFSKRMHPSRVADEWRRNARCKL